MTLVSTNKGVQLRTPGHRRLVVILSFSLGLALSLGALLIPSPAFGALDGCSSPLPDIWPPPHLSNYQLQEPDGSTLSITGYQACNLCHYQWTSEPYSGDDCLVCHWDDWNQELNIEETRPTPYQCERCHAPVPENPEVECQPDPDSEAPGSLNLAGAGCLKWAYPQPYPQGFGSASEVVTHSSATTGSGKGSWYVDCVHCHQPHQHEQPFSSQSGRSQFGNYFRSELCYSPSDGRIDFSLQHYELIAPEGPGSYADGLPYVENLCDACHTQTAHHQADGTAPGGQAHYDGEDCTTCHLHTAGFAPSGAPPTPPHDIITDCNICHAGIGFNSDPSLYPNTVCEQCHSEGGSLRSSYPSAPVVATHSSQLCTSCHDAMNGDQSRRLIWEQISGRDVIAPAPGEAFEETLCFACHTAGGVAQTNTESDFSGTAVSELRSRKAINTHHDVSDADQAFSGAKIECLHCHGAEAKLHGIPDERVVFNVDPTDDRVPAVGDFTGFCLECHDDTYAPGVTPPHEPLTNILPLWVISKRKRKGGDQHGPRTGSTQISLNGGYAVGDVLNCSACHVLGHGSSVNTQGQVVPSNLYQLKTEVQAADGETPLLPDQPSYPGDPTVLVTSIPKGNKDAITNGKNWCSTCHPNPMGGTKEANCFSGSCHQHGKSSF